MKKVNKQNLDQIKETVLLERHLAEKVLKDGDPELARVHLKRALSRLSSSELDAGCNALLISTTIEFQNICILLGKGLPDFAPYLKRAKKAAETIGDMRSRALILLHLGRFYNYHGDKSEALAFFEEGKSEVEKLGDEDILDQSAELLGFYFQMKGLYLDALPRFERAAKIYESSKKGLQLNPLGPVSLAYCYAFLGRFHNAIGTLDYYRQVAIERSDYSLATTMRAIMGMVLLMINKKEEAFNELTRAYQDAKKAKDDIACYLFASGYLSYYKLLEGNIQESWNALSEHTRQGKKTGLYRQYESPMKIEHIYELNRLGFKPVPGLNYEKEIKRYLQELNIHLRGVAYRIIALDESSRYENYGSIEERLKKSEEYLKCSGDPIQLAKTRLELARLKLKENNKEEARYYAQKAWHGFSGYGDLFFPDNLRYLLTVNSPDRANKERQEELTERFMSMIQDLVPSADLNDMMSKAVKATNRFFGAERGALFWFKGGQNSQKPVLRGANNLNQREIFSEEFKPNLDLILKAFSDKKPQIARLDGKGHWPHQSRAILCLPFVVSGQTRGVLYHDNSYVKDCFDFLEKPMLARLINSLSTYVERINDFAQRLEQSATEKFRSNGYPDKNNIITKSAVMKKIMEKIDRVALSDSTVLMLGETGVGKELLAHRIHNMSKRKEGPFVIVDSTTIPENLFESELFGYERGAFTGANHSKAGRLELAHNGTLFIDEIGEIPKTLQVKLLRVLEDKTLLRLGGKRTIFSNFRLVVATNRDLAAEVSAGRFREDLYFRLNVVPINIPPLRERIDDLPFLSRYFLSRYAAKYNRPMLELTPEQENMVMEYYWPGNIRELQNIIERAVILATGENLVIDLPTKRPVSTQQLYSDYPTIDELQRRYIRFALEKTGGKIGGPGGTAELLGMKRTTLQKRMKKLGIS